MNKYKKVMMNNKGAQDDFANESLMHQKEK